VEVGRKGGEEGRRESKAKEETGEKCASEKVRGRRNMIERN